MMIRVFCISISLLFVHAVLGQLVVSGEVSSSDNLPLEDVVVLVNKKQELTTKSDGVFVLNLAQGEYEISFVHPQFLEKSMVINVMKDKKMSVELVRQINLMDEVLVSAIRENELSPMSYSELNEEEINVRNLGQDLPILLNFLPSVVTTSDAGAGVGYTGMRVRGSDATRVNVTINGVPYNDSESQTTYWVDLPDFASSVENVQLVRGVGSSTNGSGSFGANLSLLTNGMSKKPSVEMAGSVGSFNTRKASLKFDTGLINEHFNFTGRLSRITSDGYVDRASSDLSAYFTQLAYSKENTLVKLLAFGGLEETYQSWDGIDQFTLEENRTYNYAGLYYDENGDEQFYDNQVDHYNQDHYQIILSQKLNDRLNFNLTGHYTNGRGYYEQYKEDSYLANYNIANPIIGSDTITTSDIIRRKWLDNDFYGFISSLNYSFDNLESTVGLSFNQYRGDHFGEVIWAQYASDSKPRDRYYEDYGNKDEFNVFWKNTYEVNDKFQIFADLQYRNLSYKADGVAPEIVDDKFSFFNPKVGLSYKINNGLIYGSFARANKEPSRNDYENGNPEHEELNDVELGYRLKKNNSNFSVIGYYMAYNNQLVLTGEIGVDNAPIRTNIGKSYRAGLELEANFNINDRFIIKPNVSLSSNQNIDYVDIVNEVATVFDKTNISFSPEIIAGNMLSYRPMKDLWISVMSKYVGEQFMGNVEAPLSVLDAYFVNDVSINYAINSKKYIKGIEFTVLFNNVFGEKYVSNGWWVPGYVGYYPQAGFNFLTGIKVKI